jgi:hypothetical protein
MFKQAFTARTLRFRFASNVQQVFSCKVQLTSSFGIFRNRTTALLVLRVSFLRRLLIT